MHLLQRNRQRMIFDIMASYIDPEEDAQEPSIRIGLKMKDPKIDDGTDETRKGRALKMNIVRGKIDWLCNRMEENSRRFRQTMEMMVDCIESYYSSFVN